MTTTHTAVPFRAVPREELEISGQRVIEATNGDEVAYVAFDEDADFIAAACNAHDALVLALQAILNDPTNTILSGHRYLAETALQRAGAEL